MSHYHTAYVPLLSELETFHHQYVQIRSVFVRRVDILHIICVLCRITINIQGQIIFSRHLTFHSQRTARRGEEEKIQVDLTKTTVQI